MLTPQELLEIVDTLNQWITADLISRLMARLGRGEEFLLTGTDQWQLEVYKSAGGHYEALEREIKRFTKKTDAEVRPNPNELDKATLTCFSLALFGTKSIPSVPSSGFFKLMVGGKIPVFIAITE